MSKNNNEIWWVYSTFPNREEALSIASKLLEQKLIACANVLENVTSLYHWQGKAMQESECVMIAKTSASSRAKAIKTLEALHPCDLPCIVAFPITEGNPAFFGWVETQTG